MADYTNRAKMSDINWTACSKIFASPADGAHDAVWIPQRSFVKSVSIIKTTAYGDAGATITIGFKGNGETADPDAFMVSTVADPDALGSANSVNGTALNAGGKYFSSAGCITVTCDDNAGTIGTFQIFVEYAQITN